MPGREGALKIVAADPCVVVAIRCASAWDRFAGQGFRPLVGERGDVVNCPLAVLKRGEPCSRFFQDGESVLDGLHGVCFWRASPHRG